MEGLIVTYMVKLFCVEVGGILVVSEREKGTEVTQSK